MIYINMLRNYVTMFSILYKRGENYGAVLHINVVVAIFLLFYDDKNTDSK